MLESLIRIFIGILLVTEDVFDLGHHFFRQSVPIVRHKYFAKTRISQDIWSNSSLPVAWLVNAFLVLLDDGFDL